MTQMGYESSTETADSILREVDFGRKGYVEFQEYLDVSPTSPTWPVVSCGRDLLTDSDRRWIEGAISRIGLHTLGSIGL